jgi:hypothetical protein
MSTTVLTRRRLGGLTMAAAVMAPAPVAAQGTFQVHPAVAATQVYESNLFSTPSARQEDFITRVTPEIESEYRSPRWRFTGRYLLDLERFADHPELSSPDSRQQGTILVGFRPTARVTIAGGAEYLTTRTPAELNIATGLSFTRARAERVSAHSSIAHQLSAVTTGTIEYALTSDRLGAGYESDTHSAAAALSRRVSARTMVSGRYRGQAFAFATGAATEPPVISHALGFGVTHSLTPHINLTIDAGPRLTADVLRPELSATIGWNRDPHVLSLAYARTQGTAIGFAEPVDIESLHASAARTFWRSLEVRVATGVFRTGSDGRRADVYVLAAGVSQPVANAFAVELAFDGAVQEGSLLSALPDQRIPRHTIQVRLIAGGVRREAGRW